MNNEPNSKRLNNSKNIENLKLYNNYGLVSEWDSFSKNSVYLSKMKQNISKYELLEKLYKNNL